MAIEKPDFILVTLQVTFELNQTNKKAKNRYTVSTYQTATAEELKGLLGGVKVKTNQRDGCI